jgi:hypothetical protein
VRSSVHVDGYALMSPPESWLGRWFSLPFKFILWAALQRGHSLSAVHLIQAMWCFPYIHDRN